MQGIPLGNEQVVQWQGTTAGYMCDQVIQWQGACVTLATCAARRAVPGARGQIKTVHIVELISCKAPNHK